MTDDTQPEPFKLDVPRIERIKAQLDRGEEISDEDREYLQECIRVFIEMIPPIIKAVRKAFEEIAKHLRQISTRRPAARGGSIGNSTGPHLRFTASDPTSVLDPAIRDRFINKERRNYR